MTIKCFWLEQREDGQWAAPDGKLYSFPTQAPVGAMYDATWMHRADDGGLYKRYEDGLCPVVITPDGPWVIDGPSYDGQKHHSCPWTRTGDPRKPETFSVTPSIHFPGRYHGWLRNGELVPA